MRALAILVSLTACHGSSPGVAPPKLEALVDATITRGHLLGLAVAVVDHGKPLLEKGYGFTDLDRKRPITPETIFEIGSLSKQFTAAAILRLVDEGKLKLSDRAATYLPALRGDITVEQLMWQTSGLADYAHGINVGKSPDELIRIIAASAPEFAPGAQWKYSNSNYFVLGRIVEVCSKQSYGDYLRDHVLSRAGLTATSVCGPGTAQASPSHVVGGALEKGDAGFPVTFYGGAGAICSNLVDLLRWQDALFTGKVLSPSSLAVMTTPGKLADGSAIEYAGGLISDQVVGHRRIWHNGGVPSGYESELAWYPDDRMQIALLTNTLNAPPGYTLGSLERALAIEQLHIALPEASDAPLPPAELPRYVGRYGTKPLVAVVTIDGDHLHVHVEGGVDATLLHQQDARFLLEGHPGVAYAFTLPHGAAHASSIDVFRDGKQLASLARAADADQ